MPAVSRTAHKASTARTFSPCYVAADAISKAIDQLAEMLTGDATYFHGEGTSGGGSTIEDKLAREQGRLPWSSQPKP